MKRILITGTFGFLGKNTALAFKKEGCHVTGIGHGKWYEFEYAKYGIDRWIESTITFESLMNIREKFDVIVHCGGSGSVAFSYENPYEDFQKSVQSTLAIMEFIRLENPGCKFIYPSSPAVQGNVGDFPIRESDPMLPISPYGFHKKMAEEIAYCYNKNFGINIAIIRFFSIYGAGLKKQLLWDACHKIKNATDEVVFFGTGEETRDWIHVSDAAKLIVATSKIEEGFEIVNGGSGIRTTIEEVLRLLVNCYGREVKVRFNQVVKEGDPRFYQAETSKTFALGWKPQVDLNTGIMDYVNFFKSLEQ